MKGRFVVVDYGEVVHKHTEPCPPWCHFCPHMDGHVMPYCFGSVCQEDDEDDLMHCCCVPNDPIVAHADLVGRTQRLLELLRGKRRDGRTDRQAILRMREIAKAMKWSKDQKGNADAWDQIVGIADRLETALKPPRKADAVDPSATDQGTPSTRD